MQIFNQARPSGALSVFTAGLMAVGAQGASAQAAGEDAQSAETLVMERIEILGDRPIGSPGMISVLSPDLLAHLSDDHPAEALNVVAGVNIQMNSQQEHLIAIRSPVLTGGAGQGSFLLLENGVPMRAPAFGNVNGLIDAHAEISSGVEVVKGPGSARFGSNAVHGLVNYLQPEPGEASSWLDVSASTHERYAVDGVADFDGAEFDALLGLTLSTDKGWRDESGADQQKATLRMKGDIAGWEALASLVHVNLNQETAGYVDDYEDEDLIETNPNPEAFRDADTTRGSLRLSRDIGDGVVSITPFAIHQRMTFLQHFLPYSGLEENGHDSVGLQARYAAEGSERMRWTIGGDVQWASGFLRETQEVASFGPFPQGVHYDYDVDTLTIAAFGEMNLRPIASAPAFSLTAGLRGEVHDYAYTTNIAPGVSGRFRVAPDRDDDFTLLTPKLGAVYELTDGQDVYVNLARGQRAPQASDLYRLQSLQEPGEIKVETLDSLEAGWRGNFNIAGASSHWELAAFAMKKKNFFFRDSNGLNVPDGRTEHVGVEFAADGELGEETGFGWRAGASYAEHSYAFDRDVANADEVIVDGAEVDTAPNWLADLGLSYEGERWDVLVTAEHIGEYFTNAANTRSYSGHTLLHARLGVEFADHAELYVSARNLFDERYADRADFGFGSERYFPGEPRNFVFGLRLQN